MVASEPSAIPQGKFDDLARELMCNAQYGQPSVENYLMQLRADHGVKAPGQLVRRLAVDGADFQFTKEEERTLVKVFPSKHHIGIARRGFLAFGASATVALVCNQASEKVGDTDKGLAATLTQQGYGWTFIATGMMGAAILDYVVFGFPSAKEKANAREHIKTKLECVLEQRAHTLSSEPSHDRLSLS